MSHSERQFWDELSARGFSRKRHPTLKRNSGTQFPVEGCSGKCVPFQARIPGCTFRLKLQPESASHSGRSKWDTLSQRRSNGKLRPIIRSRNGMHFPNESKTGKCIPQSALKVGRRFPMRLKRKMHPGICAQSGMRFPVEGLRGKCVPESTLEMGCSFPMRHSTENTSQKWPLSWDKISAASRILKNETRRWRK